MSIKSGIDYLLDFLALAIFVILFGAALLVEIIKKVFSRREHRD